MAGIDANGFTPKPTQDIVTDLNSGFRAVFGAAITIIAQSVFGQLIGIFADRLADLWQLGLALYSASFREGATGVQLDNIGALTGTTRKAATYTKVDLLLSGTPATVIAAGKIVSIPSVGTKFTNDAPATIGGLGLVTAEFRAVDTGPKTAFAGTVTNIETPVSGWAAATNVADHKVVGTDVETDAAYRIRQVAELRAQGDSTIPAIRAKVAEISGVTAVFVFENVGDSTDANGLPPHSFEVVVQGGTDVAIAKVIADHKPVGIATYGTTTQATTDGNGFSISIKFSRPATLNIYVIVNLTADRAVFPSNGAELVKAAIVGLEVGGAIGREVRSSALVPAYEPNPAVPGTGIAGVLETALPLIGTAASPTLTTTINVNNRQLADLDTSRITVNVALVDVS